MRPPKPSLATIRREIDSIDDSIHDLIMRRTDLVERIRAAKAGDDGFYRPSREAEIVRRLLARHSGPFPKLSLARIWREMMSAITGLQGPFSVATCIDPDRPGYWDLARSHFGVTVQIAAHQTARSVLAAVRERAATVGLLPMPEDGEADPWWAELGGATEPLYVIAKLPFVPAGVRGNAGALVVGRIAHEKSGDDHSFLQVETTEDVSRDRVATELRAAGLPVTALTGRGTPRQFLAEVADFVPARDPRLAAPGLAGIKAVPVGGFATPLAAATLGA